MSRLLAALKNLEGRGHFAARDAVAPSAPVGVTSTVPAGPSEASVDDVADDHGRTSEHEAGVDSRDEPTADPEGVGTRLPEEGATSASNADPSVPSPPVLDVGLIRGSSIPPVETTDEPVQDTTDGDDSSPENSATALLDALLDDKLGTDAPPVDPLPDHGWEPENVAASDSTPATSTNGAPDSATYGAEADVVEPESSLLDNARHVPSSWQPPEEADVDVPPVEFEREESGAEPEAESTVGAVAEEGPSSPSESAPPEIPTNETKPATRESFATVNFRSKEAELRMRLLADEDDEVTSSEPGEPKSAPATPPAPPAEIPETPSERQMGGGSDPAAPAPVVPTQDKFVPLPNEPAGVRRQPVDIEQIADTSNESRAAEYLVVASQLWSDCRQRRRKSVLIVGVGEEAHLTSMTASIAVVMAKGVSARVLLVDGDIRDRRLTEALRQTATPGLASAFDRERLLDPPAVPTTTPGLEFMPVGQPRSSIRRDDTAMVADMLRELSRRFDIVLVDGGCLPALPTEILADACDVTYPVVRVGETNIDEANAVVDQLRKVGGEVSGFIAMDAPKSDSLAADG